MRLHPFGRILSLILLGTCAQSSKAQNIEPSFKDSFKGWHDVSLSVGGGRYFISRGNETVFRSLTPDQIAPWSSDFQNHSLGNTIGLGFQGSYYLGTPSYQPHRVLVRMGIWAGGSSGFGAKAK